MTTRPFNKLSSGLSIVLPQGAGERDQSSAQQSPSATSQQSAQMAHTDDDRKPALSAASDAQLLALMGTQPFVASSLPGLSPLPTAAFAFSPLADMQNAASLFTPFSMPSMTPADGKAGSGMSHFDRVLMQQGFGSFPSANPPTTAQLESVTHVVTGDVSPQTSQAVSSLTSLAAGFSRATTPPRAGGTTTTSASDNPLKEEIKSVRWSEDILRMPIREINKLIAQQNLSAAEADDLRKEHRRAQNREYAKEARRKRKAKKHEDKVSGFSQDRPVTVEALDSAIDAVEQAAQHYSRLRAAFEREGNSMQQLAAHDRVWHSVVSELAEDDVSMSEPSVC